MVIPGSLAHHKAGTCGPVQKRPKPERTALLDETPWLESVQSDDLASVLPGLAILHDDCVRTDEIYTKDMALVRSVELTSHVHVLQVEVADLKNAKRTIFHPISI